MTGGFHLDGLADTCDGVFSARSRDRMLEIMRDSRLGTHGGLALIFVVLAKILVLSELALRGEPILASLAAACAVSRGTAALLMYRHRYAREEGLGNVFIGCYGGDDGGDFHPRSASQTYAGRANGRYAGSSHRVW